MHHAYSWCTWRIVVVSRTCRAQLVYRTCALESCDAHVALTRRDTMRPITDMRIERRTRMQQRAHYRSRIGALASTSGAPHHRHRAALSRTSAHCASLRVAYHECTHRVAAPLTARHRSSALLLMHAARTPDICKLIQPQCHFTIVRSAYASVCRKCALYDRRAYLAVAPADACAAFWSI